MSWTLWICVTIFYGCNIVLSDRVAPGVPPQHYQQNYPPPPPPPNQQQYGQGQPQYIPQQGLTQEQLHQQQHMAQQQLYQQQVPQGYQQVPQVPQVQQPQAIPQGQHPNAVPQVQHPNAVPQVQHPNAVPQGHQPNAMHQQQEVPGDHRGFFNEDIKEETEHAQDHLKVNIDTEKMTEAELEFHYFKMHDTDNNNKLDGCELIKSLIHWHDTENQDAAHGTHGDGKPKEVKIFSDEELKTLIDPILKQDDLNNDGYIDYPEFVKAQQKNLDPNQPPK